MHWLVCSHLVCGTSSGRNVPMVSINAVASARARRREQGLRPCLAASALFALYHGLSYNSTIGTEDALLLSSGLSRQAIA
jgi:hypothetical protein